MSLVHSNTYKKEMQKTVIKKTLPDIPGSTENIINDEIEADPVPFDFAAADNAAIDIAGEIDG